MDFLAGGDLQDKPSPSSRPARRSKDDHADVYAIGEEPSATRLRPPHPAPASAGAGAGAASRGRERGDDSSVCEEVKEDPTAASRRPLDDGGDGKAA
ncbi:hypothetical protein ACOMHN_051073 [Nucella lapillus]